MATDVRLINLPENTSPSTGTLLYTYGSSTSSSTPYKASLNTLSNFIIANYGLLRARTGEAYVIVETTSNEITNGINLLREISGIWDDKPYTKNRTNENRKTILLPPAVYNLDGQYINISGSGINLVGLSNSPENTIIIYSGKTEQGGEGCFYFNSQNSNICLSNFTCRTDGTPNGVYISHFVLYDSKNIHMDNLILSGVGTGNPFAGNYLHLNAREISIYMSRANNYPNDIKIDEIETNGGIIIAGSTDTEKMNVNIKNSTINSPSYFLYSSGNIPINSSFNFDNCTLIGKSGLFVECESAQNGNADYYFNNCYISGNKITAYATRQLGDDNERNTISGRFSNCTIYGTIEGFGGIINSSRIKSSNDNLPAVFINKRLGTTQNVDIGPHNLIITNSTLIGGKNCSASISGLNPFSHSLTIANCQTNKSITGFSTINSGYNFTNSAIN